MSDPSYNTRIIDISNELVPFNDDRKSLKIKAGEIRATNLSDKNWAGLDISNFLKLAGDDNTYINLIQGGGLEISSNDLTYEKSILDASNIKSHYLTGQDVNFTNLKVQDLSASSVDISSSLKIISNNIPYLEVDVSNTTTHFRNSHVTIGDLDGNSTNKFSSYQGLNLKTRKKNVNGTEQIGSNILQMIHHDDKKVFEIKKDNDQNVKPPYMKLYDVTNDVPYFSVEKADEDLATDGLLYLKGDISATNNINVGNDINALTGHVTSDNLTVNNKIQTSTNNVSILKPLLAQRNVNISGDLIVDGSDGDINPSLKLVQDKLDLFVDTSFDLNVDISNHLLVKDVSVNNNVSIVNDLNVNGKLTVNSNNIQVNKQLNVKNGANFNFDSTDTKYDFSINLVKDDSEFILNKVGNNGKINLTQSKLSLNHDARLDISSNAINLMGGLKVIDNKSLNNIYLDISNGNVEFKNNNNFKINNGTDTFLDVSTNSTTLNTNTLKLQSGSVQMDTIKFSLEKGDISNNGYIHNIGDVSLVDSRFTITKTDVSMSENVFMGQDLSVSNTVDICNTLNVLNGLTRLLELSASTVEISGGSINNTTIGLTNPADASFNYVTVANDLFVLGRSDFERDVSINGASLTVANNISGGATLHIGGRADFYNDVSINNNKSLTVANNIHTSRILITSSVTDISTSANIQGDISAGGALNIEQGATIGGDLRVKGQNLYLSNATTSDTFDSSYSYIYGGNTIVIDPLALGDASGTVVIAGDFTVRGTTTTINSTKLDVSDVNIKLASNFTGDITDGTIKPGIDISDIVTLSVRKDHAITGKAAINTIKWKSNLGIYTESDISALSGSIDTSFVVGTLLKSNTLQVNTNNLVVDSTNDKVSTNLSLSVTKDISTNSYLYVQDYIHNIGDVSLVNNNFTITPSEVSMNPNVFMGKDLSVSNNVDICNTLTVLNGLTTLSDLSALTVQIFDGSINSTEIGLTVAADASFNYVTILDELYVGSNVKTLNNNAIITNTYSAFKLPEQPFVKEDKFVHSSSLDNSGDKWYDLSADGFKLDYTNGQSLLSSNSFVKIDVKLNYVASNEAEQFISFKLMEGSNEVKHDLSLGSVFGIGSRGIYQSSFLHQPNKLNPVYSLQFWVDRGVDQTIDISSGVIIDPSSTYFYAQELYQPEL